MTHKFIFKGKDSKRPAKLNGTQTTWCDRAWPTRGMNTQLSLYRQGQQSASKARPDADNMVWSGSASKGVEFGYTESSVTITMGEDEGKDTVEKKEVPVWMHKSTVDGVPMLDSGGDSSVCVINKFIYKLYFILNQFVKNLQLCIFAQVESLPPNS